MSIVVRVAVRTAVPLLAVASVYTAVWGYTPGGGFPAGAAVAGVVLLVYVALGHRAVRRVVRTTVVEPVELAGAAVIVALGVAGIVIHGSMFANVLPLAQPLTILAGGNAQLYSGAEMVEVATGLIIVIFSLLGMGRDWTIRDDDPGDDSTTPGQGT
nr:MnhB domain-containing protein [Flexivirga oryzae]